MVVAETLHRLHTVTTTVETEADATRLAQGLIQARLAACVQVEPIVSHYVWAQALQQGPEFRLVCKTSATASGPLLEWLRAHHPYPLPQLLVQTAEATADYAAWVVAQTTTPPVQA
ncbi:MAG: divalent cation tolerance protein CutA [Burkholderiaceae bacterium]|nr:divalent cation tolerance protein CutA [Burkholderiaceae bacterium]